MRGITPILQLLLTSSTLSQADCAPAAARDDLPVAIPSGVAPGPPGASRSLYGSQSFEGPDGNPVDPADSAEANDYQLVPGQNEDEDLGLYLDLESVPNPQPIRGTGGGTNGGPRKSCQPLAPSTSKY